MQRATDRPDPTVQRKAAIARAAALDHAGAVTVRPLADFDLDRTIFQTLEGRLARYVMRKRVGKGVAWATAAAQAIEAEYAALDAQRTLPALDPALLTFLVERCDFDVEHADGSFLDHLYFCFEYTAAHYPAGSPVVMLLHSILGTGTNTFAMPASLIPDLEALVTPHDWAHIEAFPSVLRLLYDAPLRAELRANLHRLGTLRSIEMRRVIDNVPLTLSADDLWEQLNYQLIHLVDFLPVANWAAHRNDTAFILFRDLAALLDAAGRRDFAMAYRPPHGAPALEGEQMSLGGWLTTKVPVTLSERMAARSVRRFSETVGHDLSYTLSWGA